MKSRKLDRLPVPSNIVARSLSKFETDVVRDVASQTGLTEPEVIEILKSSDGWEKLMDWKKKELDMDLLGLFRNFRDAVNAKIEKGSLEQAKSGMVGISIALEKLYGKADAKKSSLKIEGTNVQVNMPFKFQPYNRKNEKNG